MDMLIIPSLIAKDQEELDALLKKVRPFAEVFQLDVMDGIFVKANSLDFNFRIPEGEFEAHLMVDRPEKWIQRKADKVSTVLAHIESCDNPEDIIGMVREKGRRVGFALNPETPVSLVRPFLDRIDQVLIMTVHPGTYGAKFLPETLEKVKEIRKLAAGIDIEVDGGMDDRTIRLAAEAGANRFVCGSFIQNSDDPGAAIAALKKEVDSFGEVKEA